MMSSRSFADRYRSLAGPAAAPARPEPAVDEWPLPPGGTVVRDAAGAVAMFDRLYAGEEIERARELIASASRAPAEARIYIDTETTGLAGGTGTYAFLVGLGWFEASGFRVRQYFMRHPGEEPALLAQIARLIHEFDAIATFNGRTFDMPLIETRFRMHRQEFACPEDHLDLLHPARAIWRHRLESCSLGTLERAVLGVVRESDAPGWLIPSIYFNYLRQRATRDLIPVIEHNRHDIVSLARLAGIVGAHLAGIPIDAHPADRLAAGLARLRQGQREAVRELLDGWQDERVPDGLRLAALREATTLMKRAGQVAEIAPTLAGALRDRDRQIRLFAAEELAKYYEHARRDYLAALEISLRARDAARLAGDRKAMSAFAHRIARLEGKITSR